jgi:integrase
MDRLTVRKVETAKPGKYGDGRGLQLAVSPRGAKKWLLRYMVAGRAHEYGLGSFPEVGLAEAREKALDARRLVKSGVDPIAERRRAAAAIPKFGAFADAVAADLAPGFRNEKHRKQWATTLSVYAAPLRDRPLNEIDTADVLAVLTPIWQKIPETASRVRGRIEKVLSAAKAKGFRTGENPAAWRGHLDHLLSARSKLASSHHAALPYLDVPAFVGRLRERDGVAALALEFTILTATRSGEVRGARWDEIDLAAKVWTIPPERMKAAREHRVPLSDRAVEIIEQMQAAKVSEYVFPGQLPGRPLSKEALIKALDRMNVDATVHGMRSAFRDWAGNETHHPREIAEQALAHVIGDRAEQAYRRSDALEKRRALMDAWAHFCEPRAPADNVTKLPKRA